MRGLVVAGTLWTAAVVAILLFWPSGVQSNGCWRLVDAPPDCLLQLREVNDRLWLTNTLPMLAVIAGGYLLVGALAVRTWRTRRH
jgi:hypothetical protein